jgi:PAS domain S-box-containing protein
MNGKREMIKELTNSAWSILLKYENDENKGILTREEAQKNAISRIQYLRYGEESKDYFWITDMVPTMIMHPFRTDLNGKDLSDFKDPHGKKLFIEFVETVNKSEHGYVNYMWQWKDDSIHIVPKLSYVRVFKPWNWVIGTGIYVEDVKKEISALTRKLLWISVGISILIAFLLFYIIKQSLNIEKKRIAVETDLHESKEKYRTLVEAATEGLLMLIDRKISFANSVLSKMIGYESEELINHSLDVIISENNNKDIINIFLKNAVIKEGQYELNIKKKIGGFVEVLVTASTAKFFGNTVNIIIIKDISIDRNQTFSSLDYQKLISTLNLGFFKVRIDSKSRILFANETAIRILGFESFNELSDVNILKLLANPNDRKSLRKSLLTDGYIKNKILIINNKNNDFSTVALSLVVIDNENPEHLICDGIIEDITLQENQRNQIDNLIAELKTHSYLIDQPIRNYIIPFYSIDSDSTIGEAVKKISKQKTDCLLLTKNEKDYIGIISNSDIQKRVLSLNLNLDNPVYLIMSSPVVYVGIDTPVMDAIKMCEERNFNHLVVKGDNEEIAGLFSTSAIYKHLTQSLSFFIDKIRKSETTDELRQCYTLHQKFIKPLINSDIFIKYITNMNSSFSDSVIKRLIELSIEEIGTPPVDFSFICLGSVGRKEESLFTDQDNAIIYEDVPSEKMVVVSEYFLKLGNMVCNSLNHVGYSFCKGNVMASNPQWNRPVSAWEKYFSQWILTPEPQNLLDASIFFDFRNVYGNEEFTQHLRKIIGMLISQQEVFLYHLACNTFNTKTQNISLGNLMSERNAEMLDLKGLVNHIIMFARTYSLQNNIWHTNTIDRLNAIKSKQIIENKTVDEIIFVYNYLMKLRFKNQIYLFDNNLQLSNTLNTKNLIDIELAILKKVLSQIPVYQNKLSLDFRIVN